MIKAIILSLICLIALIAAPLVTYHAGLWRFNSPSHEAYPVHGLDVSHHQGEIRWGEIDQGKYSFVYIKATEGGDFKDTKFQDNWTQARAAGLNVGAYHFFTLCRAGKIQADNFIASVPVEQGALPPAIDLEYVGNCSARPTKEDFLRELDTYVKRITRLYDQQPVLYVTADFYRDYLQGTKYEAYSLWVRSIFAAPNAELFPQWAIWQYADNARINGISGPVDLNAKQ